MIEGTKYKISKLRYQAAVIYQCSQDKRVPMAKRVFCFCTSYYVLGEMDLIPDFIPFVGHIDDLILMPACLKWAQKMVGEEIFEEHNDRHKVRRIESNWATYILDIIFTVTWLMITYIMIIKLIKPFFK